MARSRAGSPLVDGLLLLDKAAGLTSHDAIARARRALGTRRIGHLGTLDPFATGLLVLLVGRITRLAPYIEGEPKVYDATIAFGTETDTDDRTGRPTVSAPLPDRALVESGIAALTGVIRQQPPAYSAKQVDGVRAYDAARRGEPLELRTVDVTVHEWTVLGWRGNAELDVTITCGSGTYIRALARDLGRLANSAAHLTALRRTRSGPFDVTDAVALDDVRSGTPLRSPLEGLRSLPFETLNPEARARIARGQTVPVHNPAHADSATARVVLLDEAGSILALAERQGESWAPKVVLTDA